MLNKAQLLSERRHVRLSTRSVDTFYSLLIYRCGCEMQSSPSSIIQPATKQCLTKTSSQGTRCLQPASSPTVSPPLSEELQPELRGIAESNPTNTVLDIASFLAAANISDPSNCVEMMCSPSGQVLINGTPCDNSAPPSLYSLRSHLACTVKPND